MALDQPANKFSKDAKPSQRRTCDEKVRSASGAENSSDRFAVLASSRSKEVIRRSVSDRMKHSFERESSEEKVHPKQSVAELMRQSNESSPCSEDKKGGRARDDVFSEIRALLDTNDTLQLTDFDYRIRQHLHALYGSGGRQKLHDALKAINLATSKKSRRDVKNWPAYLRKLLTKFEEERAWKDREARAQARVVKAATEGANSSDGADSKAATPEEVSEEDEEEAWLQVLDKDLPEKDQWLNELQTVDGTKKISPPPPPMEAPPPPPPGLSACQPQGALSQSQRLPAPPTKAAPESPAPTVCEVPPMPPPALPPSMFVQKVPKEAHLQAYSKPPTQPPTVSPESYLKTASSKPQVRTLLETQSQTLHQQFQHQEYYAAHAAESRASNRKQASSSSLDFPLEAWAAWLHCPPQHVAAN